ncbi:hypothetical protein H310_07548 [Aphanomyces invadans]|uniref:Uncharacterized protein n=1 Tax=Aphanomyces invadans TaxID=157072 RepID=A0A024U1P2_9STRA|nr:hypothetical protein H310_07548 [Aphanomyces invadans]ETW00140.1 hypothetical protein H310_07548 [Aphanomyces invadans]|eukprot:XP_008871165.1 hypothetical protein H310_07548 [Aphanomyces invadans]
MELWGLWGRYTRCRGYVINCGGGGRGRPNVQSKGVLTSLLLFVSVLRNRDPDDLDSSAWKSQWGDCGGGPWSIAADVVTLRWRRQRKKTRTIPTNTTPPSTDRAIASVGVEEMASSVVEGLAVAGSTTTVSTTMAFVLVGRTMRMTKENVPADGNTTLP